MKDIFIDNNIAKNFANPMDKEYKKLIEWLLEYKEDEAGNPHEDNAFLAVSKKLIAEYGRSSRSAASGTNILLIIALFTQQGRLNAITNEQIKTFKQRYFTKALEKKMRCNSEDREHIPVVLLSERKMALSRDDNFIYDLENFPRFQAIVAKRPQDIPYNE